MLDVKVAIPHSGLRTNKTLRRCSCEEGKPPSHAVGLEPLPYTVEIRLGCSKQSPSHTVGLKHPPKNLKIKALTLSKLKQPTERTH